MKKIDKSSSYIFELKLGDDHHDQEHSGFIPDHWR